MIKVAAVVPSGLRRDEKIEEVKLLEMFLTGYQKLQKELEFVRFGHFLLMKDFC